MNARPEVAEALCPAVEKLEHIRVCSAGVRLASEGIDSSCDHFCAVQGEEAWTALGAWVEATKPQFGPGIGERFAAVEATGPAIAGSGRAFRRVLQSRARPLLADGAVVIYPTSPRTAPMGFSLVAGAGPDRGLLALAGEAAAVLGLRVS